MDAKMNEKEDLFSLDKLLSNCEYIIKYCHRNKCQSSEVDELAVKCVQLYDSLQFIDQKAKDQRFENIPINGYSQFIQIATSFVEQIANRIRNENSLDTKFIKLFDLIFIYRDWLFETHQKLIEENTNCLSTREFSPSSRAYYNAIHSNETALRLARSNFVGFWLPGKLQKLLHFLLLLIAFAYKLPFSIASLWSDKQMGKYCVQALKNVNLGYCFNVWHLAENVFIVHVLNYIRNFKIPVHSRTLELPRQTRFRIDYKGNILDLNNMTEQQIDSLFNDEIEQQRQDAPGKRHRNRETIKCRYSYIKSSKKVAESLQRIDDKKHKSPDFKFLKYYSARRTPDCSPINYHSYNDHYLRADNRNDCSIKISGQDNSLDKNAISKPKNCADLMIVIHGGGFFTNGSTSAELYLRRIVNELGGIPTLAIDYSLTVPHPIPLNEILDVYLWAVSGDEKVEQILGFHPKRICLTGDSCGAFYSLSLCITLNELNKLLDFKIALPISLVATYPLISLANITPSRCLLTLEPLVEFRLIALMVSMYGGNMWSIGDFKRIENSDLFKQIAAKNRLQLADEMIQDETFKNTSDSSPWFMTDYATYKNYSDYLATFFGNPFITPISYGEQFEELKHISLFTLVGDQDFLLDDAQELCRHWQGKFSLMDNVQSIVFILLALASGKVHLDILQNLIHGFLQLSCVSEIANEALELAISRYQEACGLL